VRRRRTADPPGDLAAGELLAREADCAVAAGNARTADWLVSARSWTGMLRGRLAVTLRLLNCSPRSRPMTAQLGVPR
jgi:hypothetical protein